MTERKALSIARFHRLRLGIAFGITDTGLVRHANEDNFLIDEALSLVIVADGMGGHQAGALASAEAILALREFVSNAGAQEQPKDLDITIPLASVGAQLYQLSRSDPRSSHVEQRRDPRHTLCDAVAFANHHVFSQNMARHQGDGSGMGTTVTGIWQFRAGGPLSVFHVGDSRLYRYRASGLVALTRDQTLYQQALECGATVNLPPQNLLAQAVGPYGSITPEIGSHTIQPGDVYLLCSDGLHGIVPHTVIEGVVRRATQENLDDACRQLIALAKAYGGKDNITAVLICCDL